MVIFQAMQSTLSSDNRPGAEYGDLANAIILQAMTDYINSCRKVKKYEKTYGDYEKSPKVERRPNESESAYQYRRYRKTQSFCKSQISNANQLKEDAERFLLGEWIRRLSDVDGTILLNECEKLSSKKGKIRWD